MKSDKWWALKAKRDKLARRKLDREKNADLKAATKALAKVLPYFNAGASFPGAGKSRRDTIRRALEVLSATAFVSL